MNWFNEYLRMNNRDCDSPVSMPGQMMDGTNPMYGQMMWGPNTMPGQMTGGADPMPGHMMGGFNPFFPGFGFSPFGFFFLPINRYHYPDFNENNEECNLNAYPYITPYY